ncbi:tRNA preQ1(34) S-adenosylmethionine ribosyltransferase-isomerase QueA [Pseudolabrys taiwanensis]|uniref:S-adenosylmethionine:tRNA ribosyltransferase-isomerase n=1 Tax=Pseudolabrys taiwanensis TaxID=331696 RepID=A0A345ZT10_9HYPH|nr:tRNA preQ1(34) S-adenosylmethionine ribosyltransferase-isomerase QueA [Pseudolabrys taiwanensis]AXK80057.1 tRNA preQ1(34) S-adenosylmethionine ribosyltransferase-isomerase QueA [Pseudolabrys taiwanensis]
MRTDLFDFDLPADRIALRPVHPRDAARLLVVRPHAPVAPEQAGAQRSEVGAGGPWVPAFAGTNGEVLEDRHIRDLPDLLAPGDCLVVNDSKVIAARLKGRRIGRGDTEPGIEATLHKRLDGSTWKAFILGAKKVQVGDTLRFGDEGKVCFLGQLDAKVSHKDEGGEVTISFSFHGPILDQAIAERGDLPLPPYIASKRKPDDQDRADYQTVFAHEEGSVAAPTAGLHFTEDLLARLTARGVAVHKVTLHVGAGTFLPVKADDTAEHKMHSEFAILPAEVADALNAARAKGGRIVAVGSTAMRTLESAAGDDGRLRPFAADTDIFITPGYRFKAVDLMLTNFHLPRSTLFMLVSAFSGRETMQRAYRHAIETGYRFYSYGDACLLFPQPSFRDSA